MSAFDRSRRCVRAVRPISTLADVLIDVLLGFSGFLMLVEVAMAFLV